MPFWTYMLHCRDRTFYVGHTDDLAVRVAQHEQGAFGGYTANKRPVKLVWSAEFPTRYEAFEAERRIKGWRKEKKLALIRGDWDLISRLAKGKGRPSTSSGRTAEDATSGGTHTVRPEPVEGRHFLLRHPSSETQVLEHLSVQVARAEDRLRLRFTATGDVDEVRLPPTREPARADQLWQHTCFEAFVRHSGDCYWEFNFSPSSHWAAYAFTGYRTDMTPLALPQPAVSVCKRERTLWMDVELLLPAHLTSGDLNLAAVIEEKCGHKSYWALAHPPEGPPDFHHPACFVLELPPATAP